MLQLLAEGRPTKEAADILHVSEKTIMFHKYHIMNSFNLKSNADLVLFALKHNLILFLIRRAKSIPVNSSSWHERVRALALEG